MKTKYLYIALFLLYLAGACIIPFSCKPKKQEIPPFVNVTLQVKNEQGKPVSGAVAYLYTSQDAYNVAYVNSLSGNYDGTGSYLTGYVTNGQLIFSQVPSNQPYWVLIHDDSQTFMDGGNSTGIKIHRDNSGANFYIDKFQNGTEIFANIKLEAVNALIKIENGTSTSSFDVMDVGNKYNGTPVALSEYIEVRKGSVPYLVRDKICLWTGTIEAKGGILTTETLTGCNQAGITFAYEGNFVNDSIKIYLGQNKTSPPVAVIKASNPTETVYVGTAAGYTYFAEMVNGRKCVWEDTIQITTGSSTLVTLKTCD